MRTVGQALRQTDETSYRKQRPRAMASLSAQDRLSLRMGSRAGISLERSPADRSLAEGGGPHAEAEPLFTRSLAITEKALGPDQIDVGTPLISLAGLYYVQGRYGEAEPAAGSLAITTKALGQQPSQLYPSQGRYVEAEPLYKRARS